jgi:hypothetical protein
LITQTATSQIIKSLHGQQTPNPAGQSKVNIKPKAKDRNGIVAFSSVRVLVAPGPGRKRARLANSQAERTADSAVAQRGARLILINWTEARSLNGALLQLPSTLQAYSVLVRVWTSSSSSPRPGKLG